MNAFTAWWARQPRPADAPHARRWFGQHGLDVDAVCQADAARFMMTDHGAPAALAEDRPLAAREALLTRAALDPAGFLEPPRDTRPPPPGGWLGTRKPGEVALRREVFDRWTRELGHDPAEILAQFKQRGWLDYDDGKDTRGRTLDGMRLRMVVLPVPLDDGEP